MPGYSSKKRHACSKDKSRCTKAGLKAELKLRAYSAATLARLAGVGVRSKTGKLRTRKVLINYIMKKRAGRVARMLGISLIRHYRKHKKGSKRRKSSKK
jgi:hypothetical protein